MTVHYSVKMPLRIAIPKLFGFIYCMILSNMLTEMPVYGGVLYLCGQSVIVFSKTFGKNRKYLPAYTKWWMILILVILMSIGILLVGLFPTGIHNEKIWILYAAVVLSICAEGNTMRISRIAHPKERISFRMIAVSLILQLLIMAGMSSVLFYNFGWNNGWPMALGFLFLILSSIYNAMRMSDVTEEYEENLEENDFRNAYAYHSVEKVSLLVVMGIELTVTSIYALLATNREWLLPAMIVAVLCTVIPAELGVVFLRSMEKKGKKDPTFLICTGLILWLCGIVFCVQMLIVGRLNYIWVYICLGICTIGGALSYVGLARIEELVPNAVSATGKDVPKGYWLLRNTNWDLARLLGDVMAIIALGIFCYFNRKGIPHTAEEVAARFQPVMVIPVLLVVIGALISAFQFPIGRNYIRKIRKVLQLQEDGVENPALRKQINRVVNEPYRQPYLSGFLMFLCRLHFRCKLENTDHIIQDDENPIVFLCNHGEFYGPMVCKIYIPVPIRCWTVSAMMYDQKAVTEYIFENTTSKQENWPVFIQRILARMTAWLSVNVMSQIESIPVYRESPAKLRETFRASIEAMVAGDNLLIFPENPDQKYEREGIGELSPGFVMLADIYWKRKGKRMRFLPLYANKRRRMLTFGEIIEFNPENNLHEEQNRIIQETVRQINTLAGIPMNEEMHEP